jgi:hypothetical protein
MMTLAAIFGTFGAVLVLVGLVGGGFTISGSFMPRVGMPRVGNWVRLPCFGIGAILLVIAIGLPFVPAPTLTPTPTPTPTPTVTPTVTPTANATPASTSQGSDTTFTAIVQVPRGYGAYVYDEPSLSATQLEQLPDGTSVDIQCTAQGDVVTAYGQSSSLWDLTQYGYLPDVVVYTGTDQATMPSC